jgi:hypothetical protein
MSIETVREKHTTTAVAGLEKVGKVSLRNTNTTLKVAQEIASINTPVEQGA